MKPLDYPITFLEPGKPGVETQLQAIGVGFSRTLASDSQATQAANKMSWLRRLGAFIAMVSAIAFFTHLFPLPSAPANLPTLLVSLMASFMGYFLMESASRSLRVLQMLHRNKSLMAKLDALTNESQAVQDYRQLVQMKGRALRVYDVAQANALRLAELNISNAAAPLVTGLQCSAPSNPDQKNGST